MRSQVSSNSIMEFNSSAANNPEKHPKKKKRLGGPGHFFRVALYMLRQTKSDKKNTHDVNSNSLWKSFFGSMRPLCVQNHQPPPVLTEAPATVTGFPPSPVAEHMEVFTPPMSPALTGISMCSSSENMSRFASALNLQELDQDQTVEIDFENGDDEEGDDMIDAKAEQFIAQFYQEIKVQNQVYNHRRNKRAN